VFDQPNRANGLIAAGGRDGFFAHHERHGLQGPGFPVSNNPGPKWTICSIAARSAIDFPAARTIR